MSHTILHAAHTETLQRGEILSRSVSEEIGCEASLTLRVSVRNDRVEYNPKRQRGDRPPEYALAHRVNPRDGRSNGSDSSWGVVSGQLSVATEGGHGRRSLGAGSRFLP